MAGEDIKFIFEYDFLDKDELDNIFKEIVDALNIQFDEDLNHYRADNNDFYLFKDISDKGSGIIQAEINNFFNYAFEDIVDKPLYKFLVLQDNDKIIVLANVSSKIFDYASINKIYSLFNTSTKFENDIPEYLDSIKNYLSSSDFDEDSGYWKNHLSDIGNHVKFYNVKSKNYKSIKIPFDRQLLNEFFKSNNSCEFNFFTAVFSLYLSRIDRTSGTLLKTVVPSPDRNTLLKIDYDDKCSFIEYLNEIDNVYSDAANHTKVDIENYVDDVLSYYSIFDFSDIDGNISIKNGEGSALTLNIYGDYLDLVYNADLFQTVYIENMASNIESLISNILNSPNCLIGEVNILSEEEISLLSKFCKGETVDMAKDEAIAHGFRRHAKINPDIIAVDDGVNRLTYGQLERLSNSVAHDLSKNYGISRGDPVCVMLPRNYHFLNVVLALNKLGAFFIPLDPIYPAQRIGHMIDSSNSKVLITTGELAGSSDFDMDVIAVEDLKGDFDVEVDIAAEGDDLFSVMFTSGTTGLPKGVMVSNRQTIGVATAYGTILKINPGDTIGIFPSFSFVGSYTYSALYIGASFRIFNELEQKDSLLLLNELKEKPMNNVLLPPGIGVPIFENEDLELEHMILAGADVGALKNRRSNTRIVNFYGATESIVSIATILDLNKIEANHVPLGRPVANTWIYILDENGMQLPIGVPGEICISGEVLGKGYYNDSDSTGKSFVDNPYCDCDDNRIMYRTGDIGFYNSDGFIEFVGREDDQLSVRGFRVESMEVIKVMESFKEISQVVLDVDYDNLIAYYTTNDDLDVEAIKEALKNALPYYMIPSLFIELESIPLNPNGKIDKNAINEIFKKSAEINIEDDVLGCVVDLFREVLGTDSVLIDDDFVALGGNSLSAMKLQMLFKDKLGTTISSNEIIELSTPINITNKIRFNPDASLPIDVNYTFEDKCPLSESQLNVYLDEMVNEMGSAYNNPFKIDLKEPYTADEIMGAISKLLDCYPILSARVTAEGESISFSFDAKPEIRTGSVEDIESFVQRFDLDRYLSRFLIVDDGSLLADFHHLIFDGSSLNIIINTLLGILNGNDVNFTDDGVLKQISLEESIGADYMDDALAFYDSMLADVDETHGLLPCVGGKTNEEYVYADTFNVEGDSLKSFLRDKSITHNQLFSGVFAYTLSRFAGSSKVFFNLIEDGRGHVDLSESVGMFVRTLPLVIDCSNRETGSFLADAADLVNSAMKYDLYPFRILASKYDLNSSVMFQYSHNLFYEAMNKEEFGFSIDELKHDSVGDLSFYIFNLDDDELGIRILYSDKYSLKLIESFAESYKSILHEMLDVVQLADIDYVSDDDLELLNAINQTERPLRYGDLLEAFNDNLARYPDSGFVSMNGRSYSYGEGAFIADKIARMLSDLGVGPDECVGFLTERCEHYMFCILGILSTGGVYVPLDDKLPDERINFMLEDTGAKVVIVSDETYGRAKNMADGKFILLNISDILEDDVGSVSSLPAVCGDLACILYTSGSTGVPKGVKIKRKSIVNFAECYVNEFNCVNCEVFALYASIGFDVGAIGNIFTPIFSGACLDIVPDDVKLDMVKLNEHFISNNVTHVHLPTQVAKLFISGIADTSLKVLVTGGEKLGEINSTPNYRFIDTYGPTEACVYVTDIDVVDKIDSTSIGHLIGNLRAYILDAEMRQVPCGAVGELCLAGYPIAEGYLNRPGENAKSFIDNPIDDAEEYNVLYRTGDMVRLLPDGSLGIVGRRDGQVKIRGNRVELTEIESAIRNMESIEDVTVQTITHNENNELIAYVVLSEGFEDDVVDYVREHVSRHKPEYMVPSFVVELDSIPLNVNGKVDKRALPDIDLGGLHVDYAAATTEDEMAIVQAFEKIFNQKIGIYDDFIRLGGDSLTAIRAVSYLEDYDISAVDILSLHTPYAIAKNIKKAEYDLDIYNLESGCPLSESQLNVYLDIVANDKYDAYSIPLFMEISKEHDVNEISDALDKMLELHPILSMRIGEESEVPYLIKGSKPPIIVENNVNEDFISDFLNRSFDLNDSLCRFLIVDDDDNCRLIAIFNHIIFDALSNNVFKHDLQTILDGKLPDMDESFLKVSAFSQQIQNTDDFIDAEKFYESMLVDNGQSGVLMESADAGEAGTLQIDLDLNDDLLKSFLAQHGISENVVFTSAFAYALSRFTGSEYASFNLIENGRDRFNNFNSIGMYVNTLPLLVNCRNQNITSFMEHMAGLIYDVMRYNYYPFRLLANDYGVNLDILFQFLPEWISNENISENNELLHNGNMIADFTVEVTQQGSNYNLNIIYSDKYSNDFARHFAASYKLILQQLMSAEKLDEIGYTTKEDIRILDDCNQTQHPLRYHDILDAFNDHLAEHPENSLVTYRDNGYSYGEGAFIANEISNRLRNIGVNKDDNVAFLVERSELYIFAILGILSVGAAYVPLDDSLPDERIRFMINDADAKVVIACGETYNRAKDLSKEIKLLNISDIIEGDAGTSSKLDVVYGDLACILYTSGTTGVPKGVKITRRAVINMSAYYCDFYGVDSSDVGGLYASIGFDAASQLIFKAIYAGASIAVVPDDIKLDMDELNNCFVNNNVTFTAIPTQVAKLFVQSADGTSLKLLSVGGEKLGDFESPKDYRLIDEFGPTEAFAFISSIDNSKKMHHSSAGFLNYNTKAYVLDDEFRRVPVGAVGELYLAGYQIADGYLNLPEENAKSFIKNPFDDGEGYETLYRTGDMVRLLPDALLGIVGRRDSQVKIRGNRVELAEIESTIRNMEIIEDVTVQAIKNENGNELVAYVVLSQDIEDEDLKGVICGYVGEFKPDYMLPSYVVRLDEIPLNVNGKVDRRALPDFDRSSLHAEYVAPRDENEREIVEAFEKALNLEKVSIYDDFVRLGGDSLTAIRLLSHIKSNDITMVDIFTLRTPEAIAANMSDLSFDLDIYTLESGCPLSGAQINVFADVVGYNKLDAYHVPGFIPISKKHGLERIIASLDELLDAHPILGMRVCDVYESNGHGDVGNLEVLRDLLNTAKKFGINRIMDIVRAHGLNDIGGLYKVLKTIIRFFKGKYPYMIKADKPTITCKSDFDEAAISDFFSESLDIYRNLSKFMIVEGEESYYLFYVAHHMIFDAISAGVFKRDFQILLDGGHVGLDDAFLKTSAFTQQMMASGKFDEASEFYSSVLADVGEVGELLEDDSSEGYSTSFHDLEFDRKAFKSFLDNVGITENVFFAGVFAYALSQFVDGDKVLFTLIENGRDRFDEDFIGMATNEMPVIVNCKDQSINSFMEDVADRVYGVLKYSYYPILHLYQKYDFEANIMFQFVPNWIADDFDDFDDIAEIDFGEITDHIFSNYNDYITEFFIQVYQNEDDYRLIITNSNRYSDKMVREFRDTFILVLSNIIGRDNSSNLSDALK